MRSVLHVTIITIATMWAISVWHSLHSGSVPLPWPLLLWGSCVQYGRPDGNMAWPSWLNIENHSQLSFTTMAVSYSQPKPMTGWWQEVHSRSSREAATDSGSHCPTWPWQFYGSHIPTNNHLSATAQTSLNSLPAPLSKIESQKIWFSQERKSHLV